MKRRENRTFACFWKGLHESVAIRRKSDVRAHCRTNRQSESEMGPWNLDWRECIILKENGIQKAKSLHRATPKKEKFLISDLEKAREFPWNDVAENLKSAIETSQDQDSSGHRRMCLTIEIVMRIGATPGCSGCARSRSHTEACRARSPRTLAGAKESESSRTVGAGVGSNVKMTVELQQPTAVMQQEPSPSSFSSPTAPMQGPTQKVQIEQMVHRWQWEHRYTESKGKCG